MSRRPGEAARLAVAAALGLAMVTAPLVAAAEELGSASQEQAAGTKIEQTVGEAPATPEEDETTSGAEQGAPAGATAQDVSAAPSAQEPADAAGDDAPDNPVEAPEDPKPTWQRGWVLDEAGRWHWGLPDGTYAKDTWINVGGSWYLMDANGVMETGVVERDGSWYYLTDSGAMATGWAQDADGAWYLASTDSNDGRLKTGWQRVNGSWYWLDPSSYAMATGAISLDGSEYYLSDSGAMLCDAWLRQDGVSRWYGDGGALEATISSLDVTFADGSVRSGLRKVGDTWYCLEDNAIQTGEKVIDGVTHRFDPETGAAVSGWQLSASDEWSYYSADGAMQTGWAIVGGTWYYLDSSGVMQTGWVNLGGTWYYLDGSGAMWRGWLNEAGTWYYLSWSGAMQTGWVNVQGSWYYLDGSGAMRTGWVNLDGTWYYLDPASGYMHTGWTSDGSSMYWLNADGSLGSVNCRWQDMFQWAQSYYSDTSWLVLVDTANCRTAIYQGAHNAWTPVYEWVCSPGAPSTPTVTGEFTVYGKGYSFGNGYTCYYYTQFYGDYLFHSVLYYQNTFRVMDGRLGQHLSHGCVRLDIDNAKWMYDNIPYGTKAIIW